MKKNQNLPVTVEASLYCFVANVDVWRPDGIPMLCFSRVAFTVGENIDEDRSYNIVFVVGKKRRKKMQLV